MNTFTYDNTSLLWTRIVSWVLVIHYFDLDLRPRVESRMISFLSFLIFPHSTSSRWYWGRTQGLLSRVCRTLQKNDSSLYRSIRWRAVMSEWTTTTLGGTVDKRSGQVTRKVIRSDEDFFCYQIQSHHL